MADLEWRRSKRCSGGQCLEVANEGTDFLVRNSTRPEHVLRFTHEEWDAFCKGVRHGEFNFGR